MYIFIQILCTWKIYFMDHFKYVYKICSTNASHVLSFSWYKHRFDVKREKAFIYENYLFHNSKI